MPDSLDVVSMSTTLYVYIHMYDDNILRIRRPQSYYLAIKFIPPFSILVNNMWRGEALHNSTLLVSSRVNNHCKFPWHTSIADAVAITVCLDFLALPSKLFYVDTDDSSQKEGYCASVPPIKQKTDHIFYFCF